MKPNTPFFYPQYRWREFLTEARNEIDSLRKQLAKVTAQRDASDAVVAASAWVGEINTLERWRNEAIKRHRNTDAGGEHK